MPGARDRRRAPDQAEAPSLTAATVTSGHARRDRPAARVRIGRPKTLIRTRATLRFSSLSTTPGALEFLAVRGTGPTTGPGVR
ncbi:MAG: hypothetical protein MZU95_12890 [Desulfomicrobium escambiense]|nr:hypothetical protein [Desulfomicrobium escambiense]